MRKKRTIIASVVIVFVLLGAIFAEALISGRFHRQLEDSSAISESDNTSQAEPQVIVVEKEIQVIVTPEPTPTPRPTPKPTPTLKPTATPKPTATAAPTLKPTTAPSTPKHTEATASTAPPKQTQPPADVPEVPVVTAPPYERPTVNETTPEPTKAPAQEVTSITLDSGSLSILVGDSWRLNVVSAPASLSSQGAKWVTSNSAVVDLSSPDASGVTVKGIKTGTATITIYSKDGQHSASCTVTVS